MSLQQMIINYVAGEECRVAIVEDGRLEELHAERAGSVSFVGNIYVGRVTNVEPAIQAAFVDFGLESNGFLHISDVHPKYFPGGEDDSTESIGKKTPRRERPPIQQCLRRGQEVIVQVLKEGISTKGPTLTSYLSIPGRYLVMLPDMDRVGVSRKVEDDDQRREMKAVLDQLELPEGFGFIMRTAGEGRGKMDLKRDLAYLQRLWKDIEKRRKGGDRPRLLYAESDLLMRALRDIWSSEITEIVIDNEAALTRAARFMKIVSPRTGTKLLHFNRPVPIYHAFALEEQISRIHAREVPLPSGGGLVIDEAEAMVAIDVNSGKMRSHGDAETTAYRTNIEAVDEICRQLRLRDVGGLVLCDLIDMMRKEHRRDIENRFRERLKRDRAATKVLPISQFGIVEMTRQRQKGSMLSAHFANCPTCSGRGMLKRPDSVSDDAVRDLAALLEHEKVDKVEMVVSPRVAGELLSAKRQHLGRLEVQWRKKVQVRVSEDIPADRVGLYAYDAAGQDLELDRLPRPKPPRDLPVWADLSALGEDWSLDTSREEAVQTDFDPQSEAAETPDELFLSEDFDAEIESDSGAQDRGAQEQRGGKRRRRRRGGRGGAGPGSDGAAAPRPRSDEEPSRDHRAEPRAQAPRGPEQTDDGQGFQGTGDDGQGEGGGGRKRRRRRRRRGGRSGEGQPAGEGAAPGAGFGPDSSLGDDGPGDGGPEFEPLDLPAPTGGVRGDSWDIAPSELAAPAPRRVPATPAPRAPAPAPSTGRTDSWDVAPNELAARPPAPAPRALPVDDDSDQDDQGPSDRSDAPEPEGFEGDDQFERNDQGEPRADGAAGPGGGKKRRRRRRRGKGSRSAEGASSDAPAQGGPAPRDSAPPRPPERAAPAQKPPSSRPPSAKPPVSKPPAPKSPATKAPAPASSAPAPKPAKAAPPPPDGIVPPKRSLYGNRRRLKPGEVSTKTKREE